MKSLLTTMAIANRAVIPILIGFGLFANTAKSSLGLHIIKMNKEVKKIAVVDPRNILGDVDKDIHEHGLALKKGE